MVVSLSSRPFGWVPYHGWRSFLPVVLRRRNLATINTASSGGNDNAAAEASGTP